MSVRVRRAARLLVGGMAAAALTLTLPSSAGAAPTGRPAAPTVTVVNATLAAPFNIAARHGRVYVADGGVSTVYQLRGSMLRAVAQGPQPGDVAGVDVSRNGRYLAYTSVENEEGGGEGPPVPQNGKLTILGPRGSTVTADLAGHEARRNPDQRVIYGVRRPSPCVQEAFGPQARYPGIVDSHPYSVAAFGRSSWIVADAGGNDLLWVNQRGQVRTLAVLPRQPTTITQAAADAQGYPDCVVGVTYAFESVPTDVEVGRDGYLYVTTLPGGPEDPSLGARGSVYRVNPWTGRARLVATGLAGATNLAIGRKGEIYVAELFAGRISVIKNGRPTPYVALPGVVSVESDGKALWAGTLGSEAGPGTLVRITR